MKIFDNGKCKSNETVTPTYRYVKVIFDPSATVRYSYIDEDRIASINDYVVVPAGSYNDVKIAMVVDIGDYTSKNAPYPVERTKRIIRLATSEEIEDC